MKKGFVAITAAIALAATSLIGTALAGIGPARGLPVVNVGSTSTVQDMYAINATAVPGVRGSVMCVACHTRNPAKRTAYNTANTAGTYVGSHFVTANFADTSPGGGYTDNPDATRARAARTAPVYLADSGASATWFGMPKYGQGGAGVINANTNDHATAGAQMICESCHNIVTNVGAAKLLATGFANGADNTNYTIGGTQIHGQVAAGGTTVPALCLGCHGNMSAGVSAEWQLHTLVGGTYAGTHHHRNTGTAPYYGGGTQTASHDMGLIGRGQYPVAGVTGALQMWGAAYGELAAATASTPRGLTYLPATNKKMNDAVLSAAQGQLRVNNVGVNAQVLCTNCHRGHNAITSGGSTILMARGTTPTMGASTTANAVAGIGQVGREAHIVNTNPLCLGCHQ